MRFTSLDQWLEWQESLHLSEIDMGLVRVGEVAQTMGLIDALPSSPLRYSSVLSPKVITVAGTNGKGSCVAALEQLLLAAGFTVGAYTSPHFLHYCERIRVNGLPVSEQLAVEAFAAIDDARGETSLTYFEFGTLAGLEVFRRQQVDFVLLEVGLGGRLDAVNIVDADVAVITSIALDHQDWLGSDLDVIAREKSGIARADKPVISTVVQSAQAVEDYCQELGANLCQLQRDFQLRECANSWDLIGADFEFNAMPKPSLPLPSVVAAILALRDLGVSLPDPELRLAIEGLSLPGRYQKIRYCDREVILDVAHNPAAAEHFAQRLQQDCGAGDTYALLAIMADKDIGSVVAPLCPLVNRWVVASLPGNTRAIEAPALKAILQSSGANVVGCDDVEVGLQELLNLSKPGDRLIVLGSFFTVAAVLDVVQSSNDVAGVVRG